MDDEKDDNEHNNINGEELQKGNSIKIFDEEETSDEEVNIISI